MKKWMLYIVMAANSLFISCEATWVNCIGNQACNPSHYYEPSSIDELQFHINHAISEGHKIRVVGGGYSISDLVCTNGYLLSLRKFNQILSIDKNNSLVHVQAGITMMELNERLAEYGLALSNQAAIDKITLGGALAVAAHGTGHTGTLSSFIRKIDLIAPNGKFHSLSLTSDVDAFDAARVSLGALGIIYAVTLQCEPLYYLESVDEVWNIDALILKYRELNEQNDFFSFSWNVETDQAIVTCRNRSKIVGEDLFLSDTEICYKALACYTMDENDKDLFSEIAIPIDNLPEVIKKIKNFAKEYLTNSIKIADIVVRFVDADNQSFLSPAANHSVAYLTMSIPIENNSVSFYKRFEDLLLEDGGRPHWGKTNYLDYEKAIYLYGNNLEKFISVKQRLDPQGVFSNDFIDRICKK